VISALMIKSDGNNGNKIDTQIHMPPVRFQLGLRGQSIWTIDASPQTKEQRVTYRHQNSDDSPIYLALLAKTVKGLRMARRSAFVQHAPQNTSPWE
jgi:hypothetical protein